MELASLAQLERCHRRHDQVMTELLEAARRLAAGRPDDGDLDRVREAVDYFERAVTRHFVDEEGSVFPRLSTRRPELAATLAELSAEHPLQIAMQAQVASAARDLDGDSRPNAGKVLLDAATRLAEAHRAHVGREDELFATAQEALTAEDDAEIVAEMETRRGRDDNGHRHGGGGGGGGGRGGGRRRERAQAEAEPPAKPAPRRPAPRAARPRAKPAAKRASSARTGAKRPAPKPPKSAKGAPTRKSATSRPSKAPIKGKRGKR
jgi:hemerythrin-like domain-containing protein